MIKISIDNLDYQNNNISTKMKYFLFQLFVLHNPSIKHEIFVKVKLNNFKCVGNLEIVKLKA